MKVLVLVFGLGLRIEVKVSQFIQDFCCNSWQQSARQTVAFILWQTTKAVCHSGSHCL